jgi:hypothetical protein
MTSKQKTIRNLIHTIDREIAEVEHIAPKSCQKLVKHILRRIRAHLKQIWKDPSTHDNKKRRLTLVFDLPTERINLPLATKAIELALGNISDESTSFTYACRRRHSTNGWFVAFHISVII